MIQAITGVLCGVGLYFILADALKIPYYKTSKAVDNLSKRQKEKKAVLDIWLSGAAEWLSKRIGINEFKRIQLEADLKTAQMDVSPEKYKSNAIVKACIVGVLAIPVGLIFPLLAPVILILAFALYKIEMKIVGKRIRKKRERIEYELPRFVTNIEKTLVHNRDVISMLENYSKNSGPELKHELEITVADMKSGNNEAAITRLESRVGSSMMSDVCRGLIGIIRGDDNRLYWASLSLKFSDTARQQLRMKAQKVPRKVKRLSMCLLFCFMMIYVVVIVQQILDSVGVLFG